MADPPERASDVWHVGRRGHVRRYLGSMPRVVPGLLLAIWLLPPLVPAETGLRFGLGFQIFFSAILLLSALFFWFLGLERVPHPSSPAGVFASVAGVYLATVGLLVAAGGVGPQFGPPRPAQEGVTLEAAARGEALYAKAEVGCFLCHAIDGRGGTRGPDLTDVAARAATRVPGLPAERYLLEKLRAGAGYEYRVPAYVPIMPGFGQTLSEEQLADLVAYLMSLK